MGFHHPGPGLIYVQAFGEWLFYDVSSPVPSPWNGQAIAILLFNAAMMTLLVTTEFVCTPVELATGAHFAVVRKENAGAPVGTVIGEVGPLQGRPPSWVTVVG
ncbi:hypothetical protein [Nocardia sp. NPDC058705]|uniref:hypothetical protein n=1 Tax=Nocardia sp. NPDC058705 TaxID=3346609 RepID=UPI003674B6D4